MQTIALLGGGGGIKVWKLWVTSACPDAAQRDIFVGATHASPYSHAGGRERGGACGAPQKTLSVFWGPRLAATKRSTSISCGALLKMCSGSVAPGRART